MFKVLVACYGKWDATAEVPYILKKGGCVVDVFCAKDSWLLANSFYDNWIDSGDNKTLYKDKFIAILEKENYQWVILGDDILINYMNQEI